jgi:hypothetical protein
VTRSHRSTRYRVGTELLRASNQGTNKISNIAGVIRPSIRVTLHRSSPNKAIHHSSGTPNSHRNGIQQAVKFFQQIRPSSVGGTSLQDTTLLNHEPTLPILIIVHNKASKIPGSSSSSSNSRQSKVNGDLVAALFLGRLPSHTGLRVSTLGLAGATLRLTSKSRPETICGSSSKQGALRSSEVRLANAPSRTNRHLTHGSIRAWVKDSSVIARR